MGGSFKSRLKAGSSHRKSLKKTFDFAISKINYLSCFNKQRSSMSSSDHKRQNLGLEGVSTGTRPPQSFMSEVSAPQNLTINRCFIIRVFVIVRSMKRQSGLVSFKCTPASKRTQDKQNGVFDFYNILDSDSDNIGKMS